MRYRLRTLLILLAVMPPPFAWAWDRYCRWSGERQMAAFQAQLDRLSFSDLVSVSDDDWERLSQARQGKPICRLIDLGKQAEVTEE